MNISELCIRRPVMTVLLMITLVVFGFAGYKNLAINNLPSVEYPVIQVKASLPGASPETVASSVALPLEKQIAQINGVQSMISSSVQGSTTITVLFDLKRAIDSAALDINSAIAAAQKFLPNEMPAPPSYTKTNPADQPIMYFSFASSTLALQDVYNYIDSFVVGNLSSINGVAGVNIYGGQKPAVRVRLDSDRMAALNVGINEVNQALSQSNSNEPGGIIYGKDKSYSIDANASIKKAKDYNQTIVTYKNGAPLRIGDLGEAVSGVENSRVVMRFAKGEEVKPGIVVAILKQPGSNLVEVANAVKKKMPVIRQNIPQAVDITMLSDQSVFVKDSLHDVQITLLIAIGLVIAVVFLFLRSIRAMSIPALAVPLSIVATFAVMDYFDYSLNNLSLMALTLAVGFVVDDAIVVMENIVRRIEMGEGVLDASIKGSQEIFFTIISMTLSLVVVFVPILLLGGMLGRLFHEFAVSIGAAILISGIISLTLTPMMCSKILKNHQEKEETENFLEKVLNKVLAFYAKTLKLILNKKRFVLIVITGVMCASVFVFMFIGKGFIPTQDRGFLVASTKAPDWVSYEYLVEHQKQVMDIVRKNPNVEMLNSVAGNGGPTSGFMMVALKPAKEREKSADEIIAELRPKLAQVPGVKVTLYNPPALTLGGRPTSTNGQFTMTCPDIATLRTYTQKIYNEFLAMPQLIDVDTDMQLRQPKLYIHINRDKASLLGIEADDCMEALYSAYGPKQVSLIYGNTNQYNVYVEATLEQQRDPDSLSKIYIKSNNGSLVPLNSIADIELKTEPLSVNHSGKIPSATVFFNVAKGQTMDRAVNAIEEKAKQILPDNVSFRFDGDADSYKSSFANLGMLLLLTVFIIYVVLGILYESYIHPLTIFSALPLAAFGALISLWICNMQLDIYAYVGIIMLVGLVKKNGIMMIDFAVVAEKEEGLTPVDAIYKACLTRFRPIMMTSLAAILGALPLALGYGAGGDARQSMGVAVVGGLIFSQLLTMYITPVIYIYFSRFTSKQNNIV